MFIDIWKKLKLIVFIILFSALVACLTWFLKPQRKPDTIIEYKTQLVLDSILKDSLVREANHWYDKFWVTKKAYDVLFEQWKEIKPDTVFKSDSSQTLSLQWEYIVKIRKTDKDCIIWTFRIDSLKGATDINKIISSVANAISSDDTTLITDSVVGDVRIYSIPMKEQEFVVTTKKKSIFVKAKKETPFSLYFGGYIDYNYISEDFDTMGNWLDFGRFNGGLCVDVWYWDWLYIRPIALDTRGFYARVHVNLLKIGKIRRR